MQVEGHKTSRAPGLRWEEFLRKTALGLGSALLASAVICWIAANWPHASAGQKLAGIQLLLAALIVTSWCLVYVQRGTRDHNLTLAGHMVGLAAVLVGGLLALVGQIYQTGADTWQLFLLWLLFSLPWLLAMRTVFLGLLGVALLNVGAGLYFDMIAGRWLTAVSDTLGMGLLLALLNVGALALWEAAQQRLGDRWRVGPRLIAMAIIGWLWVATLAGFDAPHGTLGAVVPGLMLMALMHRVYSGRRADPAMVALAMLGAFVLLAIPLIEWADGSASLAVVILVLLVVSGFGLRSLALLLPEQATPWFVSLFRIAAMIVTAVLLIALLAPEVPSLWITGLILAIVGAGLLLTSRHTLPREAGMTLAASGVLMTGWGVYEMHEVWLWGRLAGLLLFGLLIYRAVDNAALRLLVAFVVLGLASMLTWPDSGRYGLLDGAAAHDLVEAVPVYLRMWWLMAAAVVALVVGHQRKDPQLWLPVGWALVALSQLLALLAPAPTVYGLVHGQSLAPALFIIWAASALLPVVVLATLLLRAGPAEAPLRAAAPAALAVATVGWMGAPGIALAMLWLLLGHALRRRALLGFGVVCLIGYLAVFYYQLDATLLHKAMVLALTGCWLLACWYLLARRRGPASNATAPAEPTAGVSALLAPAYLPGRRRLQRALGLALLPAGLVLVLLLVNLRVYQAESLLANGQRVVLALAPVDPRSLVQGDYMALRFDVAAQAKQALGDAPPAVAASIRKQGGGYLVLRAGADGIFTLQSLVTQPPTDGNASADVPAPDTAILSFDLRGERIRIVTDAWFFAEGQAGLYAQARFGEFRVGSDGRGLLLRLLDEAQRPLP